MSQILIAAKLHLCSIFKCCTVNAALAHLAKTFTYVSFTKCYIYVRLINISLFQWLIPLFAFSVTGHTDTLSTGLFLHFWQDELGNDVLQISFSQLQSCPTVSFDSSSPWKSSRSSALEKKKKKNIFLSRSWSTLARFPQGSRQSTPSILSNPPKRKQIQSEGQCDYNSSEKPFYCVGNHSAFFFSSSLLHVLLMLFKFSTQLVFMGAKCPTKPGKFSESVSVEKLTPFLVPFLSLMLSSIKSIWVLSS